MPAWMSGRKQGSFSACLLLLFLILFHFSCIFLALFFPSSSQRPHPRSLLRSPSPSSFSFILQPSFLFSSSFLSPISVVIFPSTLFRFPCFPRLPAPFLPISISPLSDLLLCLSVSYPLASFNLSFIPLTFFFLFFPYHLLFSTLVFPCHKWLRLLPSSELLLLLDYFLLLTLFILVVYGNLLHAPLFSLVLFLLPFFNRWL